MRRRTRTTPRPEVQLPLFASLYGLDIETDTTIPMLLVPVFLAVAVFLLVAAIGANPWNIVFVVGFVWLCWPKRRRQR